MIKPRPPLRFGGAMVSSEGGSADSESATRTRSSSGAKLDLKNNVGRTMQDCVRDDLADREESSF
jgi:hypothetical protein